MSILRGSAYAASAALAEAHDREAEVPVAPEAARPKNKDRIALAALYRAYGAAICARCYRLLHSKVAARDAMQETFARVLAHNRTVLSGEEGLHYLCRVSTNVCFNLLREQRVRERAAPELAVRAPKPLSPERRHSDRQFAAALLDRCDDTAAAIAVMHYVDGMTQVEVAEVLSITRRTVFNRLRKLESLAVQLLRPSSGRRAEHSE